eukprot:scaffold10931_cov75-Phaeocystis_antarctica.AAC.8
MHRCGPHNLALASPSAFALVLSSHLRLDPQLSQGSGAVACVARDATFSAILFPCYAAARTGLAPLGPDDGGLRPMHTPARTAPATPLPRPCTPLHAPASAHSRAVAPSALAALAAPLQACWCCC